MIRRIFLLPLLLLISTIVFGQEFAREFGKICQEEMDFNQYASDKDAEAVVLFDMGKSYFSEKEYSFNVVFERTTRIKILSDAGVKWAKIEIPFYQEDNNYEEIYDIEAVSYNFENGKLEKIAFDASNTYDEKINNYWTVRKFAIPNVRKGSIIEYRYKIDSPYKFNFRDWEFQWKIPVIYSEYEVRMIPFYEYRYVLQGIKALDVFKKYNATGVPRSLGSAIPYSNNSYQDVIYKFGMKNVPAFGSEEFITSINDYIIKIDFQLSKINRSDGGNIEIITTWEELIEELLKNQDFGKYINKSKKLSSKLLDIDSFLQKSETEKFNTVLDYVKGNYNWDKHKDKFTTKSPNDLIKDKFGNCADLNLFTVGLLNGMGIESYPVILSTRNHGKIKSDYPFSHFFNYVIVLAFVDEHPVLADATQILSKNNRIPTRCINDKGLVVKKDNVEWISLGCLFPTQTITYMQMDINEDNLLVDLVQRGTEYDALNFRNKYTNKTEYFKQVTERKDYTIIDSTISVKNQLNKNKSYKLRYSFTTKTEIVNDKIYISPFLQESISDNPLKQKERKYPIDLIYPIKKVYNSTFTIPDNYVVDFLPEDLKIDNNLFALNYSVNRYGNMLQIMFDYYFKVSEYLPSDYEKIKHYFNQIVTKSNEKVVLSKK